jgi:hypothetical protein
MRVLLEKETAPPDQYVLYRVPSTPASFLQAFDSAVHKFFEPAAVSTLRFDVKPACLFIRDSVASQIRQRIRFENDENTVRSLDGEGFSWTLGSIRNEKIGRVSKAGSNIMGGVLTNLTGIGTERVSLTRHLATIEMLEPKNPDPYTFKLFYLEEERTSRERVKNVSSTGAKSYSIETSDAGFSRYIDPEATSVLTLGNDTIARFRIRNGRSAEFNDPYTEMWDGMDSASVIPMPDTWANGGNYNSIYLRGTLYGKSLVMQNMKDGNQLDAYYDSVHVATLRVTGDRPRNGVLYKANIPPQVMKAMAMFTCLPYSYFRSNWAGDL